jgi:hypothetical protein
MHLTSDALRYRFAFHPAKTEDKQQRHTAIRDACFEAADKIVQQTGPPSREQSTAITKLEEAMFWANAAIARVIVEAPE